MPPVSVMIKPASGNCNMYCDYCFYRDEMKNRTEQKSGFMTQETLKNVIRRTLVPAEGMASYAFQGGEPTLIGLDYFKKVIEYEKQYNKNSVRVTNALQTNGFAIDEDWCRFFHDNGFLIGVSIDGTREIHDFYRHAGSDGSPTYDRIYRATRLMDRFQVDYNILTVVTERTAKDIDRIYESYRENGWHYLQFIECLEPLKEERGRSEYALKPETLGMFMSRLFDLWYRDFQKGRQPYIRKFENYIGILSGYEPESCEQRGNCGVQNVVEADGSVYPCDFFVLDEYRLGNFNTDLISAINEKRKEIGFAERSLRLDEKCRTCQYYGICRGGCQRNREPLNGTDFYRNYFCEGYRMFFDHCLDRMKEIAETVKNNRN
jgi:uncharacterized protein